MAHSPTSGITPSNFRDLAERLHPRVPLRRGVLFRSDHLGGLDTAAVQRIQGLGLRRVIDLRGQSERLAATCSVPGVQVHSLAIEPTIVQVLADLTAAGHRITPADVALHMQDTYRGFVRKSTQRFAEFFGLLLELDPPTVFHCTAGKDRTGFAAALVLHALGATRQEIMDDYLLTQQRLRRSGALGGKLAPELAEVLWSVQPAFLEAAWRAAETDHGSLDGYLRDALRLGPPELRRLRALYLQT